MIVFFCVNVVRFCKWSEVTQSCLTLCDPMDCSLPGPSVHGILQARMLEWVTISFSRGSSQLWDRTQVSCIVGRFFTVWATREACVRKLFYPFLCPWSFRLLPCLGYCKQYCCVYALSLHMYLSSDLASQIESSCSYRI